MKYLFVFFLILFHSVVIKAQVTPTKHALLVGVSDYADKDWNQPLSSSKDVQLLRDLLISRGFPSQNIVTIENEQATYAGIRKALDQLEARVSAGSSVYFHFSGHGQQIYDSVVPILDELDGYDEALVPYDAPASYKTSDKTNERHLRDDILYEHLLRIRKKIGPTGGVFVTIDACHSGTGTRGVAEAKKRGATIPYAPNGYKPKTNVDASRDRFEEITLKDATSPITCFFACSPLESNTETTLDGTGVGSLTYSFISAMRECTSSNTYAILFDKVKGIMSKRVPNQLPQYEGSLNTEILNGKLTPPRQYFQVDKFLSKDMLQVRSGELEGMSVGSLVAFFPADKDTMGIQPFARGVVESASLSHSIIKFENLAPGQKLDWIKNTWGYVTEKAVPYKLTVDLGPVQEPQLLNYLPALKFVTVTKDNPHLRAFLNKSKDSLLFRNKFGYVLNPGISLKNKQNFETSLKQLLITSARAEFFRNIGTVSNGTLEAQIRFKPFQSNNAAGDLLKERADNSRNVILVENDTFNFAFQFPKRLNQKVYYSIIDVQPDDVTVMLTEKMGSPEDLYIPAGQSSFDIPKFNIIISKPYGKEHMVLLFSPKPIYLSGAMRSRGSGALDMKEMFDAMQEEGAVVRTRSGGGQSKNTLLNDLHAEVIQFEIREQKMK